MNKIIKTKYGTARIINDGYYRITSVKEGNYGKLLHRLIAADYFGEWINDPKEYFVIHHIDENKTNNCVLNLEPIPHIDHSRMHNMDKNNSGYYHVKKYKCPNCKSGFQFIYYFYNKYGRTIKISSTDIKELEKKVRAKGLKWRKINS